MGRTQGDSLRTNTIKTQKLIQIYNVGVILTSGFVLMGTYNF